MAAGASGRPARRDTEPAVGRTRFGTLLSPRTVGGAVPVLRESRHGPSAVASGVKRQCAPGTMPPLRSRQAVAAQPTATYADRRSCSPLCEPCSRRRAGLRPPVGRGGSPPCRHQRVSPPVRPARPRGRRRRRPAISREQGRASLRLASLRALLRGHMREDADVIRRPKLPRFSPPAGKPDHERAHLLGAEGRADGRPAPAGGHGRLRARSYRAVCKPEVAEITGAGREWSVAMISELSIPWR